MLRSLDNKFARLHEDVATSCADPPLVAGALGVRVAVHRQDPEEVH